MVLEAQREAAEGEREERGEFELITKACAVLQVAEALMASVTSTSTASGQRASAVK